MAVTIQQIESEPSVYPDPPDNLSTAAQAIPPAVIWDRIESYIAHRYATREVTWLVEGCGEWVPPLTPVEIDTLHVWSRGAEAYDVVTLSASASGGYHLPATGPYRIVATVGGGEIPETIAEAYRRLAEHLAAGRTHDPAIRSKTLGDASAAYRYSWRASALQDSGAADLLRQYRRAA